MRVMLASERRHLRTIRKFEGWDLMGMLGRSLRCSVL